MPKIMKTQTVGRVRDDMDASFTLGGELPMPFQASLI